jgi:hypothetical protein
LEITGGGAERPSWAQSDRAFSDLFVRAREAQLARWEDELLEIADDGSNDFIQRETRDGRTVQAVDQENVQRSKLRTEARKWLMSKRNPKKYGDRQQVDMAVKHDFSDMTDEELRKSLAEDLARLGITHALPGPGTTH